MSDTITFYLVRHGEAENNVQFILDSLPEIKAYPLTERGKKRVTKAADFLASVKADIIFSSPIRRTKETAEIISSVTGLEIIFDERLREMDMGVFNRRKQSEILKKYSDSKMRISPDPEDGVESIIEMRGRLQNFLDDVRTKYIGKKVIVVSHGDPLEQLHGILTNEAPGPSAVGWYPEEGAYKEVIWQV